jgi:hypothetical protein
MFLSLFIDEAAISLCIISILRRFFVCDFPTKRGKLLLFVTPSAGVAKKKIECGFISARERPAQWFGVVFFLIQRVGRPMSLTLMNRPFTNCLNPPRHLFSALPM